MKIKMKESIKKLIKEAVVALQKEKKLPDFDLSEIAVGFPDNEKFGDYSTNLPMVLAKDVGKKPMETANQIKDQISKIKKEELKKVEVAKPGYINFHLSNKYLQDVVSDINKKQEKFGDSKIGKNAKINNEFISANPTGPLHMGNGRGGYYGDVISNVLKKCNFDVVKEYYVNDAGEQIIKLGHSIKKDSEAVYQGDYIDDVLNKLPKSITTETVSVTGAAASGVIMSDFIKPTVLEKMKIENVNYVSEKTDLIDSGLVEKALKELKNKNLTYEQGGAIWLKTTEYGDDKDRVLIKSDGSARDASPARNTVSTAGWHSEAGGQKTYLASDCGYILNKIERGFSKIIEIWGADHHGYVKRFEAVAKALEFKGELKFILVQLVRLVKDGKEVKMSKRSGDVVYMDDLINEVGNDVARFFFLMYSPDTHMSFDLGLAKEKSDKNPVYYVQYAHARICSILQKAKEAGIDSGNADLSKLVHEKELSLIKELNKFPELVEETSQSYEVHKLPHYAIRLADKLHSFYDKCQVINEGNLELSKARHKLMNAVRIVLLETLGLIGISAPEQM